MKVKPNFILQDLADDYLIIPIGGESSRRYILKLTETSAFLWRLLESDQTESSLVHALTEQYNVDEAQAVKDVKHFLKELNDLGCLE